MNWMQCLSKALDYVEAHLTEDINLDAISVRAYTSGLHFQLIFHLVTDITVGEYIRNRRLSLAAQDLLRQNAKIVDVAARYRYECVKKGTTIFLNNLWAENAHRHMNILRAFSMLPAPVSTGHSIQPLCPCCHIQV